jgi:hypothetical protein
VLFHLDPHQCAEMCSEIAEPEHERVHKCLRDGERVGTVSVRATAACWRFSVVECVGRPAGRRPMTKWDGIEAKHGAHGKACIGGRRMHDMSEQ